MTNICVICEQPMSAWTRNVTASEATGGIRNIHHHHAYGDRNQFHGGTCVCDAS